METTKNARNVWKLFCIYAEYHKGTESYEELQDYVQEPKGKDDCSTDDDDGSEKGTEDTGNGYLQVDFAGLKKVNPDVIAWIQIPVLDISYPVVHGKDNYYYLHHMFDGQENKNGSIGYTYSFPEPEDFQKFVNTVLSYSGYDIGVTVTASDHIVTLSTCVNTDRNYRYLVHGKLVQKIQN